MSELVSEPTAYKKPVMSVGEEFIAWAEQYWNLEQQYSETTKNPAEKGGENCPYKVVRQAFVNKINETIGQRINDYL